MTIAIIYYIVLLLLFDRMTKVIIIKQLSFFFPLVIFHATLTVLLLVDFVKILPSFLDAVDKKISNNR